MHAETEARFASALLDRQAPVPPGLKATPKRFALYRGNVSAALVGALETRFPVSAQIVGEVFFRAMAAEFVIARPPISPVLLGYGDELPDFAERFEAAASVPYLADVMRLEIARSRAYHAADAEPAGRDALAAIDPQRIGIARAEKHPAAGLLSSIHPVATIAAMHAPGAVPQPIEHWCSEDILVTRPHLTVLTHVLAPGGHAFLATLFDGRSIGEAVDAGLAASPSFDPAPALAGLITSGAILGFGPE
jgi:hypothetical protein